MSKRGSSTRASPKPQWSMVIVRLTIPIGVTTTDRLDIQVEVPPAARRAWPAAMLPTGHDCKVNRGASATGPLAGPEMAIAQGPIMIGTPAKPNDPKVGRVLGGGKVKKDAAFARPHQGEPREFSHSERC